MHTGCVGHMMNQFMIFKSIKSQMRKYWNHLIQYWIYRLDVDLIILYFYQMLPMTFLTA